MSEGLHVFLSIDFLPMLAAVLAAMTCGLLGNFLVLRRLSLMGDTISHAVLPGLVIAFLVTGMRSAMPMMIGAAIAGIVTVVLVEVVKRFGRVEPGAAMGVVFSLLFALGVLLIERAAARAVDLDADCVLHGQLETLFWFPPREWSALMTIDVLQGIPRPVWTLLGMFVVSILFISLIFKELRIAAFDPALATTQGFHAGLLHYMLMILVAAATVASFEAVGSILVIAMLICPAATARLLTDRLLTQLLCSAIVAAASGILGYLAATLLPAQFGLESVNAAGMMTVIAGALLMTAVIFSPRHGVLGRAIRRRSLRREMASDDLLASIYRQEERGSACARLDQLKRVLAEYPLSKAAPLAIGQGLVTEDDGGLSLTDAGRARARDLIRRHRLWESYLVSEAGLAPDHVHEPAEVLEHLDIRPAKGPTVDPHGKTIPENPADRADQGDAV